MQKNQIIALIPARGGSKRIPNKNIVPFFGHPLLAYTIAAAINSYLFDKVIVSTDDPLIATIAQWYNAEYLLRPSNLATDRASLVDVANHLLDNLEQQNIPVDALCQLMPNCPLKTSQDIIKHYNLFNSNQRSFQISVVNYRGVYPHWALQKNERGEGNWVFGSQYLIPSQELGKVYCPTGAIWWVKAQDFKKQKAFYGNPFYLELIDANRGIDIDEKEDLELAEILVRGIRDKNKISPLEPIMTKPFLQKEINNDKR